MDGEIDSQAANHPFAGPASLNYPLPGLQQQVICIECLKKAAAQAAMILENC